ncbi:hypothetical protein NPIL_113891 [Nephila pilipes]|uniref:Uncharacterized protein n=1 Tax=Nephila pilipes TaxID=299642 RepID=A0A8X6P957_NEPPI|nr:hypothetical protein NPIL_113891 [Nephila pilipes]
MSNLNTPNFGRVAGLQSTRHPNRFSKIDPHTRSKSASPDALSKSTRDHKTLMFGKAVHPPRAPQLGTHLPSTIDTSDRKTLKFGREARAPEIGTDF